MLMRKKRFVVTEYVLHSRKISGSCSLVLIGDLHNTEHGNENREIVRAVKDLRPDIILCIGDMVIGRSWQMGRAVRLMEALAGIAPVYAVNGNHETNLRHRPVGYRYLMSRYKKAGVHVLNNTMETVVLPSGRFRVAGLELPRSKYKKLRRPILMMKEMKSYLPCRPEQEDFTILLAHNPEFIPQYFRWGADLTLSGHNHGGFMKLPGGQPLVSAYGFLLPPYSWGLYGEDQKSAIVTAGLGDHTLPFRIHNPMEIVSVHLLPDP